MALTKSSVSRPGDGEPPPADLPRSARRSPRRWWLRGLGALLAAAVIVLAVLAATYQPVQFGGAWGGTFPGLPAGVGIRAVNTFGGTTGQTYIPPQSGIFTITESIFNPGPEPVIIEAVSILSPQQQAQAAAGIAPWPLTPAGPVHWMLQYPSPHRSGPVSGASVAGVSLAPGQGLTLGIPLRMPSACYITGSWSGIDTFYVKDRFLAFTHWVAVQVQSPLLLRQPDDAGVPAQDLTCPK
jgi:hypothetical protein